MRTIEEWLDVTNDFFAGYLLELIEAGNEEEVERVVDILHQHKLLTDVLMAMSNVAAIARLQPNGVPS